MRKNILTIVTAIMIMLAVSSGAFAFGPANDRGRMGERMIERMGKDIGLTQPQKDKFLAGEKRIEEESRGIRAKNKEIFDKIEKELIKESPDSKVIYGYMQQISQNDTQIQFKRMEQIIQLRKELTPEQRAKLEKLMKDRKEQEKKRFEEMKKKWQQGKAQPGPEGPLGPGGLGGPLGPGGPEGPAGPAGK